MRTPRLKIRLEVQVKVFFRDKWLCRWCDRPVIFPPALGGLNDSRYPDNPELHRTAGDMRRLNGAASPSGPLNSALDSSSPSEEIRSGH